MESSGGKSSPSGDRERWNPVVEDRVHGGDRAKWDPVKTEKEKKKPAEKRKIFEESYQLRKDT